MLSISSAEKSRFTGIVTCALGILCNFQSSRVMAIFCIAYATHTSYPQYELSPVRSLRQKFVKLLHELRGVLQRI